MQLVRPVLFALLSALAVAWPSGAAMPDGAEVSGLESDGGDLFYAGGGKSGRIRAIRGPARRKRRR